MAPHATKRRKLSHSPDDSEAHTQSPSSSACSDADEESFTFVQISEDAHSGRPYESKTGKGKNGNTTESFSSTEHHSKGRRQAQPTKLSNNEFLGVAYTGEVFKSNLFKLQVDELLGQVRPILKKQDAFIEHELRAIKSIIEAIPARAPVSVSTYLSLDTRAYNLLFIGYRSRINSERERRDCHSVSASPSPQGCKL
jgi:U3 small nucleolar RNA-associated protein 22